MNWESGTGSGEEACGRERGGGSAGEGRKAGRNGGPAWDVPAWQSRTALALGEEAVERLARASVLVVGLGGVGAYAAEMIARCGVGRMVIADGDRVSESNLNRQLPALHSSIGRLKAEVMAERLLDINPALRLETVCRYLKDQPMIDLLEREPYHYVVDAIDTLSPKIYLLYHCRKRNIPVVSAMGTGGKSDPARLAVCDISQTYNCPLADVLRKRLHKLGVYHGIQSVFSPEPVKAGSVRETSGEPNKKSMIGTVPYMPVMAGCLCASVVVRELCGEKVVSDLPVPASVRRRIEAGN